MFGEKRRVFFYYFILKPFMSLEFCILEIKEEKRICLRVLFFGCWNVFWILDVKDVGIIRENYFCMVEY